MTRGAPWYHVEPVTPRIIAGLKHCQDRLQILTIDTWTTCQPAQTIDLTEYRHLTKLVLPATEAVKMEENNQLLAKMALFPTSLKTLVLVMAQRGRAHTIHSALLQYANNERSSRALMKLDVIWERCKTLEVPEMREVEDVCARRGIVFRSRISHR
jgi:hypothetical protein